MALPSLEITAQHVEGVVGVRVRVGSLHEPLTGEQDQPVDGEEDCRGERLGEQGA
jgi:hypothetical protein